MLDSKELKKNVSEILLKAGFKKVRFASVHRVKEEKLSSWLAKGFSGDMHWMEMRKNIRLDPSLLFSNAQTIISLAIPYRSDARAKINIEGISRYAQGTDYHKVIKKKLKTCIREINDSFSHGFNARITVDSAPIMEKYWAAASGIGWQGKNSNILSREMGSYFFLAELITDSFFPPDLPAVDYCGSCTKCIDACPTNAIVEPYVVDASKCLSYLTIENKDENWAEAFQILNSGWAFGCDICQEVCPWNKFSLFTDLPAFEPRSYNRLRSANYWLMMTGEEFNIRFRSSAVRRAGFKYFQRNIRYLLRSKNKENAKKSEYLWAAFEDEFLQKDNYWKDAYLFFSRFYEWWQRESHTTRSLWKNWQTFGERIEITGKRWEKIRNISIVPFSIQTFLKKAGISHVFFMEWMAAKWHVSTEEVGCFYQNNDIETLRTFFWHLSIFLNSKEESYFDQLLISDAIFDFLEQNQISPASLSTMFGGGEKKLFTKPLSLIQGNLTLKPV